MATSRAATPAAHGGAMRRAMRYVRRISSKLKTVVTDRAHMTIRGWDAVRATPPCTLWFAVITSLMLPISPACAAWRNPAATAGILRWKVRDG